MKKVILMSLVLAVFYQAVTRYVAQAKMFNTLVTTLKEQLANQYTCLPE